MKRIICIGNRYLDEDFKSGKPKPSLRAADNSTWLTPAKDAKNYGYRSFGIGFDVEDGTVPDFYLEGAGDR